MKPKSIFRSLILTSSAILASQAVHAAPYNWTGATNGTWNTGTNWSGSLVPTSADDLTILGPGNVAGALNINFDADNPANSINFTNTAATTITNTTSGADRLLTLASSGTALTVGSGAVTIGSATANQGVNVALGASQTWNVGAGGLTVNSIISGTGFGLTKSGTGTLTLSRANTFSGGLTLNGGVVAISNAQAMGLGSVSVSTGSARINAAALTYTNDISIAASRILSFQNTGAANSTASFSGAVTGSGGVTLVQGAASGTTIALSSASNNFTGNITLPTGTGANDFISLGSMGDGGSIVYGRQSWRSGVTYTGAAALPLSTRSITLASTFGGFGNTPGLDGGGSPINMFATTGGVVTMSQAMVVNSSTLNGIFYFGGTNSGDNTFSGLIVDNPGTGTLGIGKWDGGKWIISNASNSFAGNVYLFNGTLSVPNIGALGNGSVIQMGQASTGTLEYTGSANASSAKQIVIGDLANNSRAGGATILNNGTGTLSFTNATFNSLTVPWTAAFGVTTIDRTLTLGGSYADTGFNHIQGTIQDNVANAAQVILAVNGSNWALSGANTYSGGTSVNAGTLRVNAGSSLGATTAAVSLGSGTATAVGAAGNLILNENVTTGAFTVKSNTATIAGADVGVLNIASGKTLTINGAMTVGLASGTVTGQDTRTALSTAGGGSLIVNGQLNMAQAGNQTPSPATSAISVLDLSGLANFTNNNAAGNTLIGASTTNLSNSYATLTLASTSNLINALSFRIGNSGTSNSNLDDSVVNLGAGTNTIQANTIVIGSGKAKGTLQFAGSTGSVSISGTDGIGTAAITIGNATSATFIANGQTSNLLLAGHSATVNAGAVIAAQNAGNTGGAQTSSITFDTGTFNANSVTLASSTSGSSSGSPTATFTVGGPTANSAATGVLTVTGDFLLANNVNSTAGATGTATGSLIINGGTVNIGSGSTNGIFDATTSTVGTSSTTLTLAGGTLDLNGGAIGGTANAGKKNITNLNFQSGTLKNVSQINGGAGLTKTTNGTLIIDGTNTYTGSTSVTGGTLLINGSTSTLSAVTVDSGATLGGSGGTVGGSTTVNGTLASGSSIGTLNFTNALAFAAGSTFLFELDNTTNAADLINVGGTLSIAGTAMLDLVQLGAYAAGDKFTLFGYTTGSLTGTFSGLADGFQFTDAGGVWEINYDDGSAGLNGGTGNLFVTVTAVPEPNVAALIGALGGILLLRRRR